MAGWRRRSGSDPDKEGEDRRSGPRVGSVDANQNIVASRDVVQSQPAVSAMPADLDISALRALLDRVRAEAPSYLDARYLADAMEQALTGQEVSAERLHAYADLLYGVVAGTPAEWAARALADAVRRAGDGPGVSPQQNPRSHRNPGTIVDPDDDTWEEES